MGQSLSNVMVHFVFSTKQRTPWIEDIWRNELHSMTIAILAKRGAPVIAVNSVKDHVHMLVHLPRTVAMSDLMRDVKTETSEWIHKKFPRLRLFQWQTGYGAFSVSASHKLDVVKYIESQEERHRTVSFQDEFRRLLERYEVKFDEAYLWD